MNSRETLLHNWLKGVLLNRPYQLTPLAGDASFRRYYRLQNSELGSRIVMDAPPVKETLDPFIKIAALLRTQGLTTPAIEAIDKACGFLLLEDFGDHLLLSILNEQNADHLYSLAMDKLLLLQQCSVSKMQELPCFNRDFILSELQVFQKWFLHHYLKLELTPSEQNMIQHSLMWLANEVSQQSTVLIHRDYHSRNLMWLDSSPQDLGIIDFQDAMQGPLTYDLVSLLKDCYIQWPRDRVLNWVRYFYDRSPLAQQNDFEHFYQAFELCGLQRHLKVLGVFSRLCLRDNKDNYLKDLPLTLHYTLATLEGYSELASFYQFMLQKVQLHENSNDFSSRSR